MGAVFSEIQTDGEAGAVNGAGTTKRVLLTGGLGYIGSWLTRALARSGHEVFVLSRGKEYSPGSGIGGGKKFLPDLGVPYTFIAADLVEEFPEALAQKLPDSLDVCVHAAAAVDGSACGYARAGLLVNGLGTRNMLEALCLRATAQSSRLPLFLYCSTFHVYGQVTGHVTELTAPAPVNDYALTHLFGEEYCRLYARNKGIPCAVLRLSNGYGAPLHAPFKQWNLLVADLCRSAFERGRITLRAKPELERDFVWLGDVADVVERLVAKAPTLPIASGTPDVPVFNIASGLAVSLGEVVRLAGRTAADSLRKDIVLDFAAPGHEREERFTPSGGASPVCSPTGGQGRFSMESAGADILDRAVAWDEMPDLQMSGTGAKGNAGRSVQAQPLTFPDAGLFDPSVLQANVAANVPPPGLFVDNSAIRGALPGLVFSSRLKEEMLAILEFLRLYEHP